MIYVFFRITAFFLAISIIFPSGTPRLFKICFSFLLSLMIALNIEINSIVENFYELIKYGTFETINGLVLGYIVNMCFYSLKMAGNLIDIQLGLSMASTYDPNTQTQSTIMEKLMYFIGIVVFFNINAHHILINSIQNSFEIIPVGYSILDFNISYILRVFVEYFIMGIKIASPIIVVLIITDLITGIISRSISGLNVMIIGMPLKMLVGILFFMSSLPFILNTMKDIIKQLKNVLEGTLVFQDQIIAFINTLF
ncbi:flagellar biosynthetic protein FliR [Clostridium sp. D53t1_180928_C8]|uniref:flagellar biosynthetic protein FliR n=1 Tax=Clostridium sp. D53t1_180928_C8 TaxID=2787101 RepID=UPI001FABC2E9|nr:flagellar biosynthetic protein FliR [Clostridium sp. D53t1_180928_C8]